MNVLSRFQRAESKHIRRIRNGVFRACRCHPFGVCAGIEVFRGAQVGDEGSRGVKIFQIITEIILGRLRVAQSPSVTTQYP